MSERTACRLGILIIFAVLPRTVVAQEPVAGVDIFLTLDSDTIQGWSTGIRSLTVRSLGGSVTTVSMSAFTFCSTTGCFQLPPFTLGNYGPLLSDGTVELEPFLFEQTLGNLGGAWFFQGVVSPSGTIPAYHQISGPVAGARMGIRIGRVDRRPIELLNVEYLNAVTNFEIGTTLSTYGDIANYQSFVPPMIGPLTFQLLVLPDVPMIRAVKFLPGPFSLNPGNGTFSVQTVISSVKLENGAEVFAPAVDPFLGGMVSLSGTYTGTDLATFSDISLGPTSIVMTAIGGVDGVSFVKPFANNGIPPFWALGGRYDTYPSQHRILAGPLSGSPVRLGAGSTTAALLSGEMQAAVVLRLPIGPAGPYLEAFEFDSTVPNLAQPEFRWSGHGNGAVSFGMTRASAGSTFRNFAVLAPTNPLGSGPFFGIQIGPELIGQLVAPFGLHPLYAAPDAVGNYFWGTPPGVLPVGLTADVSYVEISAAGAYSAGSVTRITF